MSANEERLVPIFEHPMPSTHSACELPTSEEISMFAYVEAEGLTEDDDHPLSDYQEC